MAVRQMQRKVVATEQHLHIWCVPAYRYRYKDWNQPSLYWERWYHEVYIMKSIPSLYHEIIKVLSTCDRQNCRSLEVDSVRHANTQPTQGERQAGGLLCWWKCADPCIQVPGTPNIGLLVSIQTILRVPITPRAPNEYIAIGLTVGISP